jgi:uncharacterized OB-fold protein
MVNMEYKLTFVAWREGMRAGKLLGLKCKDCGAITCPPRKVCSECTSENLDIIEVKGTGKITTFTVCYTVPSGFEGPYVVAIADLDEGGRVMGNVLDVDPTKVGMELIGKKVTVGYKEIPADYMSGQDTRLAMTLKIVN